MIYVSDADLEEYLGPTDWALLTDRDGSGTDLGATLAARTNASSEADSYVYMWIASLTVYGPPAVLKGHVNAIAVHMLAGDRETPTQRQRYEDAVKWLMLVAQGKASLGIPPVDDTGSSSAGGAQTKCVDRVTRARASIGSLL